MATKLPTGVKVIAAVDLALGLYYLVKTFLLFSPLSIVSGVAHVAVAIGLVAAMRLARWARVGWSAFVVGLNVLGYALSWQIGTGYIVLGFNALVLGYLLLSSDVQRAFARS